MGAPHCIHYLLICIDLWSLEFYCFFISIYSKTYCIKRALPFLPTCHHAGSLVQEQQVWLGHLGSRGHCYWWDHLQSHEPTNKLKNKWCYGMEHSYTFLFYVFIQIWIWWSWASTQGMSPKMAFNPLFPVSAGFKLPSFEQCPVYTSGWVLSRMVLSCIV